MRRYELTDFEWAAIQPVLPTNTRGKPRVDDRRVLNGIFWVLRSGAPWRDIPERYGPYTTCYNRFVRWRKAGVWDRLMDAVTKVLDRDMLSALSTYFGRTNQLEVRVMPRAKNLVLTKSQAACLTALRDGKVSKTEIAI